MNNMSIYHNRQVASTILFVLMLFCWFGCSTDEDDAVPAYKIDLVEANTDHDGNVSDIRFDNGKTYTVKTNNKGQGVFKIYKHLKKGSYNAVITVPENSYYNKVIKKVKITVK